LNLLGWSGLNNWTRCTSSLWLGCTLNRLEAKLNLRGRLRPGGLRGGWRSSGLWGRWWWPSSLRGWRGSLRGRRRSSGLWGR